jgi:hypothetical protein
LIFQWTRFKHEVHSILAFYLNGKQFVAATKITRRNTMHIHKKYPGKPFSTREEKPTNNFLYSSREIPPPPRRLAPKRGAHFSQEYVLAEISKLTQKI